MDTACKTVIPQGSRRLSAVETARQNHEKACENRILARARATNAGKSANGK